MVPDLTAGANQVGPPGCSEQGCVCLGGRTPGSSRQTRSNDTTAPMCWLHKHVTAAVKPPVQQPGQRPQKGMSFKHAALQLLLTCSPLGLHTLISCLPVDLPACCLACRPACLPASFVSIGYTAAAKMFSSTTRVCPSTSNGQIAGFLNPVLASCQLVNVARPGEEPGVWDAQEDMRLLSDELADKNGEALHCSVWRVKGAGAKAGEQGRWRRLQGCPAHRGLRATGGFSPQQEGMTCGAMPDTLYWRRCCCCWCLQAAPCLLRSVAGGLTTPPMPAVSC